MAVTERWTSPRERTADRLHDIEGLDRWILSKLHANGVTDVCRLAETAPVRERSISIRRKAVRYRMYAMQRKGLVERVDTGSRTSSWRATDGADIDAVTAEGADSGEERYGYKGEYRTAAEWDRVMGFGPGTVSKRLRSGWTVSKAVTTEVRCNKS
jgi:hypothetical protein